MAKKNCKALENDHFRTNLNKSMAFYWFHFSVHFFSCSAHWMVSSRSPSLMLMNQMDETESLNSSRAAGMKQRQGEDRNKEGAAGNSDQVGMGTGMKKMIVLMTFVLGKQCNPKFIDDECGSSLLSHLSVRNRSSCQVSDWSVSFFFL